MGKGARNRKIRARAVIVNPVNPNPVARSMRRGTFGAPKPEELSREERLRRMFARPLMAVPKLRKRAK